METGVTFYDVLGVEPNATFGELKDAYRKIVVKYHPDKGGDTAVFQTIQTAWSVLRDPDSRRRYDAEKLANAIKSFKGIVAAEVPLADFDYDVTEEIYSFACRCGDFYEIELVDLFDGVQIVSCNSCSLLLKVMYDEIVEDDKMDQLEEDWAEELGIK
eukprot:g9181.t1